MKYVLFVLDTSTSIGVEKFNTITASLSKLVHLFCKAIKVAVMTFSHEHYAEFCFGCYGNDCVGRDRARDAMRNINFRSGLTFTGEAAQCVCDFMLSPACGFPNLYSTVGNAKRCLDVVFVTDGGSNGHRNVCEEVQCLHNLTATHVHVIAMGVGRYKQRELDCITEGFPEKDQFKFKDFEDLSNVIEAGERLIKSQTTPVTCFNTETVFGLDPSSDCQ